MKKSIFTLIAFALTISMSAQSVVGKWKSIDDETGEAKSIIEIYEKNGKTYGKVAEILNKDRKDVVCEKCKGNKKDKPILGMVIMENMKKVGKEYKGGTIVNPEKGKEYKCKIWLDENDTNKLIVRGYWGFIYKTQNWIRVE